MIPLPPTTYLKAGAAAAALLVAFSAGWLAQGWRKDAEIQRLALSHQRTLTAAAENSRVAEGAARSTERQLQQKLQEAQDAARQRETTLRRDADAARTAVGGLRDDLAALRRRTASDSEAARALAAAAVDNVLLECADRYRGLAETADRHVSDLRTLIDAWPTAK